MLKTVAFDELSTADLLVDAVYEGGAAKNTGSDPLSKLLPGVGNQGGFRAAGPRGNERFVVLYSSGEDLDWPDKLNLSSGQFAYYGDNKKPGHDLHDTIRGGNRLLRAVFDSLHSPTTPRASIPPFFVFTKLPTSSSARSIQFRGLAVPGFPGVSATDDLIAVWRTTEGQRFQNYRAIFTILDISTVSRAWLKDLAAGKAGSAASPRIWQQWQRTGKYVPLASEPTTITRSIEQQSPDTPGKIAVLDCVWRHFQKAPVAFEGFAARIYQMTDQRVIVDSVTRASVDGGRDAMGRYVLGTHDDPVYAEFSLEAKCYRPAHVDGGIHTVGVSEVSRLISRIKHRQFGVLVTTSAIARQAYQEVREDRHPIVFLAGRDIAEILIQNGYNTVEKVTAYLSAEFTL
jgi:hypothetical protein